MTKSPDRRRRSARHMLLIAMAALAPVAVAAILHRLAADAVAQAREKAPSKVAPNKLAAGKTDGPAAGGASGKSKPKFDPVQVNGTFFEGWPKPKFALFITGRQDGYLEPCGCAGLENQKGGVSRRYALMQQLEQQGWKLLPIDVGGLVRRFGKQSEIKFAIAVEALKKMGYRAVGFGPADLRLSAGEVAAAIAPQDDKPSMFVCANANLYDLNTQFQIVTMAGKKIGITAILGDSFQKELNNSDVQLRPAAEAIKDILPKLETCDLRVLLAYATIEESRELAKQFPDFQVVVTAEGGDEPTPRPLKVEGTKSKLIEVGHKGMYAIVLGFFDDPQQPIRYQRVALDSRYPGTAEMKQLMDSYQSQLQALGWQGLELRPVPHPRGQGHDKSWGEFAGVKSCKECHPTAYKVWEKSKHAHATESLVKADPPRQFDAECISCHATGWNPQEFFPYASGYVDMRQTSQLAGNTCENCHGPAAAHVAAERGTNIAKREELRAPLRLQKGSAEQNLCRKCHDLDNSPEFNFDTYWPKVEHQGKR